MSNFYIIPDEQKDFWGSELLNAKQQVPIAAAHARIKTYADAHNLRGDQEFQLDAMLQRILKTERKFMLLSEVPTHLAYLLPPQPSSDHWCAATNSKAHTWDEWKAVGQHACGPVWAANCTGCGYRYIDH